MRKRESRAVYLSVVITLLIVAPAFAIVPTPYGSFGHVYEMNFAGWKTTDTGTGGGWTLTEWDTTGTGWAQGGGSITHSNNLEAAYDLMSAQDGLNPVGGATAWTLEINAQVTASGAQIGSGDDPPGGLYVGIKNSASVATELVIQSSGIMLRSSGAWISLGGGSNSDGHHTTRVVKYAGGSLEVYRDGATNALGGQNYAPDTNGNAYTSFVVVGDASYKNDTPDQLDGVTADVDYVAFDIGTAYAPEPATLIVMLSGMAACLLVKRR